jgi:hypothetical protein
MSAIKAWIPSALLLAGVAGWDRMRDALPLQISSRQQELYSSVASVGATLLGFLIAAIALLAVLPATNAIVVAVKKQGLLTQAIRRITDASWAMALFTGAGLAGLVIDQPPGAAIERARDLGIGAYWVWAVAATALPAAILLVSSMAAVGRAVRWLSSA